MRTHRKMVLTGLAAALLVAAALLLFRAKPGGYSLVLKNSDTGEVYATYPLAVHDQFSVEFIHSVNQSPVREFYELRAGGELYVVETHYYAFGAGVQTELNPGETLEYGEDGSMQIKGSNIHIPAPIYRVGTVSDHIFTLHGSSISLRELCGRSSSVAFTVTK